MQAPVQLLLFGSILCSVGFGAVLGIADTGECVLLLYGPSAQCCLQSTKDLQGNLGIEEQVSF